MILELVLGFSFRHYVESKYAAKIATVLGFVVGLVHK
jgi:hypothetical protein